MHGSVANFSCGTMRHLQHHDWRPSWWMQTTPDGENTTKTMGIFNKGWKVEEKLMGKTMMFFFWEELFNLPDLAACSKFWKWWWVFSSCCCWQPWSSSQQPALPLPSPSTFLPRLFPQTLEKCQRRSGPQWPVPLLANHATKQVKKRQQLNFEQPARPSSQEPCTTESRGT